MDPHFLGDSDVADIAKSGSPSLSSPLPPPSNQTTGLVAGEALGLWDAVRIHSDGKVYKATGAANNASARVIGFVPQAHSSGDKDVTIYHGNVNVRYGAGMTPGGYVFLSGATAGALADAASTGGIQPLGIILDATRIRLFGPLNNA